MITNDYCTQPDATTDHCATLNERRCQNLRSLAQRTTRNELRSHEYFLICDFSWNRRFPNWGTGFSSLGDEEAALGSAAAPGGNKSGDEGADWRGKA